MGADIYLGKMGEPYIASFRDGYTPFNMLDYLGLHYWTDLAPKLEGGEIFPLQFNDWLLGELRTRKAERLEGPAAVELAAAHLPVAGAPNADPARIIELWTVKVDQLIGMVEMSTRLEMPLIMSL